MQVEFYKFLFAISTDSLAQYVIPSLNAENLEKVRKISRVNVNRIMDGRSNYYMEVDSSIDRQSGEQSAFFFVVRTLDDGEPIAAEVTSAMSPGVAEPVELLRARESLKSIAGRFSDLETEGLLVPLSLDLQEVALDLAANDLHPMWTEYSPVREQIESSCPTSTWDKWVLGADMFDGIDDVVKLAAKELAENSNCVRFVQQWRKFLPPTSFEAVSRYLVDEARAELAQSDRRVILTIEDLLRI